MIWVIVGAGIALLFAILMWFVTCWDAAVCGPSDDELGLP
jgi:hypothetical protein